MTLWKPGLNREVELTPAKARTVALALLARREHSPFELHHKLIHRGFTPAVIEPVLDQLVAEGLIDESRYAEVYAHSRADKGYGPLRIHRELRERGIAEEIIFSTLSKLDDFWMSKLANVYRKRWATTKPRDGIDEAKRIRFLRYRGYSVEQIKGLLASLQ